MVRWTRMCACVFVLGWLLSLGRALAIEGGGAGWQLDQTAGLVVAMSAIDVLNVGTTIVNLASVGEPQASTKSVILSYLGGLAGLIAGGLGAAADDGGVQALGVATFGLAAINIALATWNVFGGREAPRFAAVPPEPPNPRAER